MATLHSRFGHYIFALWFRLSSSSIFSPSETGCLPYFHTWCGLSANLGCRSETCCTRLAGNAGPKKSPKIRHLGTITQLCRVISSQLRHVSGFPLFWKKKIPGVFQSNFRIFQVLSVIVRNRISNTFGPQ